MQIQPFYVTEEPDGASGKWFDVESDKQVDVDPATILPDDRKKYRYEGPEVIYTFWAKHGPCYRCLYPEPPPPGLVPSCAEGGVLGIHPATVGAIHATATNKTLATTVPIRKVGPATFTS